MIEEVWVEKYRPKKLSEIAGQKEVIERLKSYVSKKNMPNMLFAGPPGIGKTTAALALAYELFGEAWGANFLELNASDERGIDVVRGKIKEFARSVPIGGGFKIIFLDEADALTKDAQNAMRRTMERYSRVCRFILSCNYSSKIIEPIQSRTALFRFRQLKDEDIKERIIHIASKESLKIDEKALEMLIYASEGDLRRAINILQSSAALAAHITQETVSSAASAASPEKIAELLQLALKGEFTKARKLVRELMIEYSIAGEDLIEQIYREVLKINIDEETRVKLADVTGEYEFRLIEGSNESIQLEALLAQFSLIGKSAGYKG